jgi:hypothetical protein
VSPGKHAPDDRGQSALGAAQRDRAVLQVRAYA